MANDSNGVVNDRRSRSRSRSPPSKRGGGRDGKQSTRRVYVTNIPYNCKWTELKDLFREKVGDVAFVDLFEDEMGRFKGNGIVEFRSPESVEKAIDVLNKYEFKGRPLYLKEDYGDRPRGPSSRGPPPPPPGRGFPDRGGPGSFSRPAPQFNTYGLSPQFLESLNITGPLVNKIFVANLSFKVDENKLRDVFSLAGRVQTVDLKKDKDGNSKGLAVVVFDHPVEAVQAISMFHGQKLFNRTLTIRMDRFVEEPSPSKLPSGLSGIGKGLGDAGQPLKIPKDGPPMSYSGMGGTTPSMNMMTGNMGMTPAMGMMNSAGGTGMGMSNPSLGLGGGSTLGGGITSPSLGTSMGSMNNTGFGTGLGPSIAASSPAIGGMGIGGTSGSPALGSGPGFGGADRFERSGMGSDSFSSRQSDTIVLRNLPSNVTWQMLKDRFRDVGDIRHVDLKGRGVAIMRFSTERDARRAVDLMHGLRVDGRPIDVSLYN